MKITIMRDQLIAALCTAAKAHKHACLNAVYVEATNMETRLSSTDGTVLSCQRADAKGDNEVEGVVRLLVPRAVLEGVKNHKVLRTVEINNDGGQWALVDYTMRIGFEPIDGSFPDVRRVIPANPSGEAAQFSPALIAQFAKAALALGATCEKVPFVMIRHNGAGSALVSIGRDAEYTGVLMPLRVRPDLTPPTAPPSWAQSQLEAEVEVELCEYRVWPDGTAQETSEAPHSHMSDDYRIVRAEDEHAAGLMGNPPVAKEEEEESLV